MTNNDQEQEAPLLLETSRFASPLQQHGVRAALRYLNDRTPHRYTGLFRFDGDVPRCQGRPTDLPLLEAAAALLHRHLCPGSQA